MAVPGQRAVREQKVAQGQRVVQGPRDVQGRLGKNLPCWIFLRNAADLNVEDGTAHRVHKGCPGRMDHLGHLDHLGQKGQKGLKGLRGQMVRADHLGRLVNLVSLVKEALVVAGKEVARGLGATEVQGDLKEIRDQGVMKVLEATQLRRDVGVERMDVMGIVIPPMAQAENLMLIQQLNSEGAICLSVWFIDGD
ncbi:hypothetical protein PG990_000592 [Apiospora arundinis]